MGEVFLLRGSLGYHLILFHTTSHHYTIPLDNLPVAIVIHVKIIAQKVMIVKARCCECQDTN
jgi:hypothetical protein